MTASQAAASGPAAPAGKGAPPGGARAMDFMPVPAFSTGISEPDVTDEDYDEDEAEDGPTLAEDLRDLAEEAKALALAELAYQKSRATYAASEAKGIAILAVVALVFVFFAVMAFVVGLVIALGPLLTAWGAMVVVTLGLLAITAACGLSIRARMLRIGHVLGDDAAGTLGDLA